jgi:hypothetical protein
MGTPYVVFTCCKTYSAITKQQLNIHRFAQNLKPKEAAIM